MYFNGSFAGNWNETSPFESREVGTGTVPAPEPFESISQESSFDNSHSDMIPNDMVRVNVYAHNSLERNLYGDDACDDQTDNNESSTQPFFQQCSKDSKKVTQHHTSKLVKSIRKKKVCDTKSLLKAKLDARKQQELKKIELIIKEEPAETEPCNQQESEDTELHKQQESEDTESYKSEEESVLVEPDSEDTDPHDPNVPERSITKVSSGLKRKHGSRNKADMKTRLKVKKPDKGTVVANVYCKMCEHTFTSQKRYDNHLTKDRCRHECEFCGKVFLHRTTYLYKLHLKYHKKQKDQECRLCGKLFVSRGEMLTHVKHHTNPRRRIVCEICGLSYGTQQSLTLHKNNMHNDNREKLLCPNCPRMFMSPAGLTYHIQTKHDEENIFKFPCNVCGKICKDKKLLKAHLVSHKETRDFQCDVCPAVFKTLAYLNLHKKRHEKAFVCFCQYCQKGFYESKALREHENTHTGAKPYSCTYCDYTCANRANLGKHEKLVHKK